MSDERRFTAQEMRDMADRFEDRGEEPLAVCVNSDDGWSPSGAEEDVKAMLRRGAELEETRQELLSALENLYSSISDGEDGYRIDDYDPCELHDLINRCGGVA